MATHLLTVEPDQDGIRLDNFLTAFLPEQSRSHVQRLIKDGRVTGPVASLRPSTAVHAGQVYEVEVSAEEKAKIVAAAKSTAELAAII